MAKQEKHEKSAEYVVVDNPFYDGVQLHPLARRLHHGRDLGEPFDFLTWFEFAPEHEGLFDELLARLLKLNEERAAAEKKGS